MLKVRLRAVRSFLIVMLHLLILKDSLQAFMKMRRRPKLFIIMEKVYVRKALHVIMSSLFIFLPH